MGLNFRKSKKIAPGVKLNVNKKSMGVTLGNKYVRHTVNSKGRSRTTVGLPGTGLSYTKIHGNKPKKVNSTVGIIGGLLALALAVLIFSYLWIVLPVVLVVVYFARGRQMYSKGIVIGASVVTAVSLALFIWLQIRG